MKKRKILKKKQQKELTSKKHEKLKRSKANTLSIKIIS